MLKVFKIAGLHVDNNALPVLPTSDLDRLIAQMPGIRSWFDPTRGADVFAAGQILDRASGNILDALFPADQYAWKFSTFPNSTAPAFLLPNSPTPYQSDKFQMNATEFSIVAVARWSADDGVGDIIGAPTTQEASDISVRLTYSINDLIVIYQGITGIGNRLQISPADVGLSTFRQAAGIIMATFSVSKGLTLWFNGVQGKVNTTDLRALTNTAVQLCGYSTAVSNGFGGHLGHVLVFDVDLSSLAYAGYRNAMNRALMGHYGIV